MWDTHGISGNVFANPVASSSAPYPKDLNPWNSGREEPLHSSSGESDGHERFGEGSQRVKKTLRSSTGERRMERTQSKRTRRTKPEQTSTRPSLEKFHDVSNIVENEKFHDVSNVAESEKL